MNQPVLHRIDGVKNIECSCNRNPLLLSARLHADLATAPPPRAGWTIPRLGQSRHLAGERSLIHSESLVSLNKSVEQ